MSSPDRRVAPQAAAEASKPILGLLKIVEQRTDHISKMELPEWVDIVKTARFKELPPYDPDWYYTRAASIARKIYLRQGIGVGGFQKIYGGRQRNGSRPPHFCKSSGAISRNILQQLQKMGIIDVDPKGGRLITSQGRRDLDQVAGRVAVEA
ncbi:40S ribosomal protein S19 [Dichanthelium oligosanthes]|uniref:40S ribosomal protein S19 n=1 Tax=Dichanthelium oligosanthes TaxID=888268 RepID=A0A1E5V354_9POAL|nr:40S ribosomal protein S19 [Dichanthelium oligosanthes]